MDPTEYFKVLGVDFTTSSVDYSDLKSDIDNSAIEKTLISIGISNPTTILIKFNEPLNSQEEIILTQVCLDYEFVRLDNLYATIKDIKTPGSNGGSIVSNTWTIRELNNISTGQNFASLSNNQITLEEGTYHLMIKAPAFNVRNHQIRLWDVENEKTIFIGSSAYTDAHVITMSEINDILIIKDSITFEIHHKVKKTNLNTGLGIATGFNEEETFTFAQIIKLS